MKVNNVDVVENEKKINFFTLLVYFVALALFVVMRICGAYGLFNFLGVYGSYFLSLITQVGIIFLVPLTIFAVVTKSKPKHVAQFCMFKKVSYKVILISFVLGVVVFLLNNYVSTFFNSIIQFLGYHPSASAGAGVPATWWTFLLNLVCTAVLPAFAEEILHRGLLLNGVSMMGMRKSILISGALFGLFHLNIEQCFYAMIIGFFLAYLCYACSSIYPCIIVHFMNNALSVFLSFARQKGWAVGNVFSYVATSLSKNAILGIIIYVLFFLLLLMILGRIMNFIMKESFHYTFIKRHKEVTDQIVRENFYNEIENIKNNQIEKNIMPTTSFTVEFKDLFDFFEKNKSQIEKMESEKMPEFKPDIRAKILLWGSFVLSIVVTIMTFVWGLLR